MTHIDYSELNFGDGDRTSIRRVTIGRAVFDNFDGIRIVTKNQSPQINIHTQYLTELELDELIVHLVSAKLRLSK